MSAKAATDEILERLKDPLRWEVKEAVPVFREYGAYTMDKLHQLVENSNRREKDSGDLCPITVGHTVPGAPEEAQPRVIGFARNFRMGNYGPGKIPGILADFWYMKECYEEAKKYPRRSAEVWRDDLYFDPISVVVRTPVLDLGVMSFARSDKKDRFVKDEEPELFAMAENWPGLTGDEQVMADRFMCHYTTKHPLIRHLRSRYGKECGMDMPEMYTPGFAGPTNTYLPGDSKMSDQHVKSEDFKALQDSVQKMQKELTSGAERFTKLQTDNEKLQADNAKLAEGIQAERFARETWEKKFFGKEREVALKDLATKFDFDVAEELKDCDGMTVEQFARHCERVIPRYKPKERRPIADSHLELALGHDRFSRDGTPVSEEEREKRALGARKKAEQYVRENKMHPRDAFLKAMEEATAPK